MDTMFASARSGVTMRGITCLQLFVTDRGFLFVCPLKTKQDVPHTLGLFFTKVAVPDAIVCDQKKEQMQGESMKLMRDSGTMVRTLEPNMPWAN